MQKHPVHPLSGLGSIWTVLPPLVLALCIALIAQGALGLCDGHFTYSLDDAYIHMSMAKNFASSAVWGVTPYTFSSTTSSPLWTGLISAFFFLLGPIEWIPLCLNILIAFALILVSRHILLTGGLDPKTSSILLILIILISALPALIFTGMEHILHALLALLFIVLLRDAVFGRADRQVSIALGLLSAALALIRYETIFLVAPAILLLLLMKKRSLVASICVGFFAMWAIYGLISVSQGWFWVPNSILLKSQTSFDGNPLASGPISLIAGKLVSNLFYLPLTLLFILSIWVVLDAWGKNKRFNSDPMVFASTLLLLTVVMQMLFGIVFPLQFMRYEFYLIFAGLVFLAKPLLDLLTSTVHSAWARSDAPSSILFVLLLLLSISVLIPLLSLPASSLTKTPQACSNIYHQQYQMGRFLHLYYPNGTIAANDIGAITFLSNIHLVDLYGLSSMEVAESKLKGTYDTAEIDQITKEKGAEIAIVYDSWFQGPRTLPSTWIKAGEWTIPNNVICGDDRVSFYALANSSKIPLREHLESFLASLPEGDSQNLSR